MNVLLLSAYDARSHQLWHTGLCEQLPEHDWTVLTLPPRHFAWRARSNAMHWYLQNSAQLNQPFELLIATSMVDLVSLRGLVPRLASIPNILYFHENQFAYPQGNSNHSTLELQLTSIYSALAADALVFNSRFNRDTFINGATKLMGKTPDNFSHSVKQSLEPKCSVLPVPLNDLPAKAKPATTSRPAIVEREDGAAIQIVWNHRWEFDKGPQRLLAFAVALLETHLPFQLHVVGQQFRQQPAAFADLRALLQTKRPEALGCLGFIADQADYFDLLESCHFVLSTAVHDFQGLAILEGIQAGCVPLVPNRLAYPEWVEEKFLYACALPGDPDTPDVLAREAASAVQRLLKLLETEFIAPDVTHLGWDTLRTDYQKLMAQLKMRHQ